MHQRKVSCILHIWLFLRGFYFCEFRSQSSQKFALQYMAIYSNENITKILKSHPEYPHLHVIQNCRSICMRFFFYLWLYGISCAYKVHRLHFCEFWLISFVCLKAPCNIDQQIFTDCIPLTGLNGFLNGSPPDMYTSPSLGISPALFTSDPSSRKILRAANSKSSLMVQYSKNWVETKWYNTQTVVKHDIKLFVSKGLEFHHYSFLRALLVHACILVRHNNMKQE